MSIKERIHKIVDSLPEGDATVLEEMQYRLYVLEKVQHGLAQLDEGKGVDHETVRKELAQWLED